MKRFSPEMMASRRRRMGFTQVALSRATGISQVSICAIEKGKKEPRSGTLARLAEALQCSLDSLFTG